MEEVNLFSRLESTEKRFEEINEELCNPEILSDQNKYKSLMKELKNLINSFLTIVTNYMVKNIC